MSSLSFGGGEKVNFSFTLDIVGIYNTHRSLAFGASSGFLWCKQYQMISLEVKVSIFVNFQLLLIFRLCFED